MRLHVLAALVCGALLLLQVGAAFAQPATGIILTGTETEVGAGQAVNLNAQVTLPGNFDLAGATLTIEVAAPDALTDQPSIDAITNETSVGFHPDAYSDGFDVRGRRVASTPTFSLMIDDAIKGTTTDDPALLSPRLEMTLAESPDSPTTAGDIEALLGAVQISIVPTATYAGVRLIRVSLTTSGGGNVVSADISLNVLSLVDISMPAARLGAGDTAALSLGWAPAGDGFSFAGATLTVGIEAPAGATPQQRAAIADGIRIGLRADRSVVDGTEVQIQSGGAIHVLSDGPATNIGAADSRDAASAVLSFTTANDDTAIPPARVPELAGVTAAAGLLEIQVGLQFSGEFTVQATLAETPAEGGSAVVSRVHYTVPPPGEITAVENWHHRVYFKASNTGVSDSFGDSIALDSAGDTLAVGASDEGSSARGVNGDQEDNRFEDSGAVYVFRRSSKGVWAQEAYIKASNTNPNDAFGTSIALDSAGDTLAVGAVGESSDTLGVNGDQQNSGARNSGAVYVFRRSNEAVWSQVAYIKASNTDEGDTFGNSIALNGAGNTLAVGATGEDSNGRGVGSNQDNNGFNSSGAVYVFHRSSTDLWSQAAYIKASNPHPSDSFGESVALNDAGNTLAVGAESEDGTARGVGGNQSIGAFSSGAVYVFRRSNTDLWSQEAYIKASNTGENDRFGNSVALASVGDTLAVGARFEGSNARGVGGDQANNDARFAGAVYVFRRSSEGVWAQEAYIKASNTDAGDGFSNNVALNDAGDTLAVTTTEEDSNARGVGGDQESNGTDNSGAVYVFRRSSENVWTQAAYIKASNTSAFDRFGRSIALDGAGAALVAGAHAEDSRATGINGDQGSNDSLSSGAVYLLDRRPAITLDLASAELIPGQGVTLTVTLGRALSEAVNFPVTVTDPTGATNLLTVIVRQGATEDSVVFTPRAILGEWRLQVPDSISIIPALAVASVRPEITLDLPSAELIPGQGVTLTATLGGALLETVNLPVTVTDPTGTTRALTIAVQQGETTGSVVFTPGGILGEWRLQVPDGISITPALVTARVGSVSRLQFRPVAAFRGDETVELILESAPSAVVAVDVTVVGTHASENDVMQTARFMPGATTAQVDFDRLGPGEWHFAVTRTQPPDVVDTAGATLSGVTVLRVLRAQLASPSLQVTAGETAQVSVSLVEVAGAIRNSDMARVTFTTTDPALSVPAVNLIGGAPAIATVSVGLAAMTGQTAISLTVDESIADAVVDAGVDLGVTVRQRGITVSFNPAAIELVSGGFPLLDEERQQVSVQASPPLRESETIEVTFTPDPRLMPVAAVTLRHNELSKSVSVSVLPTQAGPFNATLALAQGAATNLGTAAGATFGADLQVSVVRRVNVAFRETVTSPNVTEVAAPAGAIALLVTTDPQLISGETATLRLSASGNGFSVQSGEVVLSADDPTAPVVVIANQQGQTGVLSTEATDSAGRTVAVTQSMLSITALTSDSAEVLFESSTPTLLKGGIARRVAVTTRPELVDAQTVAVTLDVSAISGVEITAVSGMDRDPAVQMATVTLNTGNPMDSVDLRASEAIAEDEYEVGVATTQQGVNVDPAPSLFVRVVSAIQFRIRAFLEGALQ